MIELDLLISPIPGANPCGSDLDLDGDPDYLNFFAAGEALLPTSYFDVADSEGSRRRFDPKSIDADAEFEKAKPLLERTHDLRLIVFLAKIAILSRDLGGFVRCLESIAVLLDQYWANVHPRVDGADLLARQFAIEALDAVPTVVMPLNFHPLLNSRRHGWISYRSCLIARGEIKPREDDLVLDQAAIEQAVDGADIDELENAAAEIAALSGVLARIKQVWRGKAGSTAELDLERLSALVQQMSATLASAVGRRDPAAAAPLAGAASEPEGSGAAGNPAEAAPRLTSIAEVGAALDGVAGYFRQFEPSSPALLLVLQAQQMLGKSFIEALRILVPKHTEAAAINIGRDIVFNLPIERMAGLLAEEEADKPAEIMAPNAMTVTERRQALGLLDQVAAYYRVAEPSSPIPYLTERARQMAQRDFLTLLRDVLPEGTLKSLDKRR